MSDNKRIDILKLHIFCSLIVNRIEVDAAAKQREERNEEKAMNLIQFGVCFDFLRALPLTIDKQKMFMSISRHSNESQIYVTNDFDERNATTQIELCRWSDGEEKKTKRKQ